jgi:hypothetical protein
MESAGRDPEAQVRFLSGIARTKNIIDIIPVFALAPAPDRKVRE